MKKPPILIKYGSVGVTIYQGESKLKGKSKKYPLYTLVWREGRKRYRKAFRNLGKATDHAGLVAKRLESGHRTAARMSNADAEAFGLAMKDLAPLKIPLNVAVKEFVQASKLIDGGSIVDAARFYSERRPTQDATILVRDAVEEFLVAKQSDGVGNRYLQDVRSRLRRFAKAFPLPLSLITSALIETWLRQVAKHPRTRNNFRQHIVTLFRWARDRGYLPREAQTEAERLPLAKDRGSDIEVFSPSAMEILLNAADEILRPYLAIRAFAGVRDSELRRLTWENIRFEQGVIEIRAGQAKTATRRLIPILPNLRAWIAPYKGRTGRISYANAERIARRVANENGIKWIHNGLRHGYGSYRLAVIKNTAQTAHEMGNTERMVHRHYKELVTESEGIAWFAISPAEESKVVRMIA
jgi:integrase